MEEREEEVWAWFHLHPNPNKLNMPTKCGALGTTFAGFKMVRGKGKTMAG